MSFIFISFLICFFKVPHGWSGFPPDLDRPALTDTKGRDLGYGKYFINAAGGAITDDHQYVISGRNIPSIDIINYDPESKTGFASYWHTQKDNMENIDRETLKAAGQTVLEVIYNR